MTGCPTQQGGATMPPPEPAPWEVEWRVVEVFRASLGLGNHLTPETRLVDVGADSLDMIALVMDLEEAFQVRLDDRRASELFTRLATLRELAAALVVARREQAPRQFPAAAPPPELSVVPFTQLGGATSRREWLEEPLHE